jgi:hypothetical protein
MKIALYSKLSYCNYTTIIDEMVTFFSAQLCLNTWQSHQGQTIPPRAVPHPLSIPQFACGTPIVIVDLAPISAKGYSDHPQDGDASETTQNHGPRF